MCRNESVNTYNRAAESFFQRIKDSPALINKPFHSITETPYLIYKLGLLLAEMDIGINHTVLDFGAGSCWVSSCLNRMGCKTVSMDISTTALEVGKRLFELDKRHRIDLDPEFLTYDGFTLPIKDRSVDRIICFDAFHHVPNPQGILDEMWRVLKNGGRAGFAEPGMNHSKTPQSISEMQIHGVLESDFIIEDFYNMAVKAGFTKCFIKPYPCPNSVTFDLKTYQDFINGNDKVFPLGALRNDVRHNSFVILQKGEDVFDSRNPRDLMAKITIIDNMVKKVSPGEEVSYLFEITNTGDTIWLSQYCKDGGFVDIGGHLLDADERLLDFEYHRTLLPEDVMPSKSVKLEVKIKAPQEKGTYFVEFDMVDEAITWFVSRGSKTVRVKLIVE